MGKVPLTYPIGTLGQPWQSSEREEWLQSRQVHRSYLQDVVVPLNNLQHDSSLGFDDFSVVQYGLLDVPDGVDLPLYAVISNGLLGSISESVSSKPTVLVTGGTHGYETSGIMGALHFLTSGRVHTYLPFMNVVVVPCVSPWSYERVERWVSTTADPNRSFGRKMTPNGEAPLRTKESSKLMTFLDSLGKEGDDTDDKRSCIQWLSHIDLHETTQTDCSEFRPAKAARDGVIEYDDHVPDGFYLVGDIDGNHLKWYDAILDRVEKITHIAELESDNTLSGYPAASRGLILVAKKELGLCAGGAVPNAKYLLTTEVYPDSDRTTPNDCVQAQVEAVCAAFDFIVEHEIKPSL